MTTPSDESAASSVAPIEDDLADAVEAAPPSPAEQSDQADGESDDSFPASDPPGNY